MKLKKKYITTLTAAAVASTLSLQAQEIIQPLGINQISDVLSSDACIAARVSPENIIAAKKSVDSMNKLIKEAIVQRGLANDGVLSIADAREINSYLVENHLDTWYTLRGQNAGQDSSGFYLVNRRGIRSQTTIMNNEATRMWGQMYNIGFPLKGKIKTTDYTGRTAAGITTVGYNLGQIMKSDIVSGSLENTQYSEVQGTTGTQLDSIVNGIFTDEGLLRKISTGDMREGAGAADSMNHLIIEAIVALGLGNDSKLTTADIRSINHYLVENHQEEWLRLHGDDENGEETGYHCVQNDGATARMFADNVMNSIADGIYHLGFETDRKNRLLNEDGNVNKRFEKVAWWLDTILKDDLEKGALSNDEYEEVEATTGTALDKIVPYIYNNEGLLLRVSMEDIREGARSANAMNELIVESIRQTGVAEDNVLDADDVKQMNAYLVNNYASQWSTLHGDDEQNEETGYHRIQNDGASGTMYNRNVINSLADGIYHLGFYTKYPHRLSNEDGNKNKSFKSVAYWLNEALQEDFARGVFQ